MIASPTASRKVRRLGAGLKEQSPSFRALVSLGLSQRFAHTPRLPGDSSLGGTGSGTNWSLVLPLQGYCQGTGPFRTCWYLLFRKSSARLHGIIGERQINAWSFWSPVFSLRVPTSTYKPKTFLPPVLSSFLKAIIRSTQSMACKINRFFFFF